MNGRVLVVGAGCTLVCGLIAYAGFSGGGVPPLVVGIAGTVMLTIAAMGTLAIAFKE